jgi:methylase of polypeptide subunit release factors
VATSTHPVADSTAARSLGAALRRLEYSEDGITRLLGDDAFESEPEDAPIHLRRLPDSRLAKAIRLLFLQLPLSREDAEEALGRRGVEALERTGLADVGDEVVPRGRIVPVGDLLLASDGFSNDLGDPPDYVATYTPTARLLDLLTPRLRVERALDVGTGSGVHALLAARHADRVVATDVNQRALDFTALNAELNGLSNVECRLGSLFEPVEGETFDLIICNAPFVVSPERRWAYRDSELEGDEVSKQVVNSAAEHLAEDGYASLLVSWLAPDEENADERAAQWVDETGCDGWILSIWEADPIDHAAGWNSHLEFQGDGDGYGRTLDEWQAYFDKLGVGWVSEGAVILHRTNGRPLPVRVDGVDGDELDDAHDQIPRAFANRALLEELRPQAALLELQLSVEEPLRVDRELGPGSSKKVVVSLELGTCSVLDASPHAAEVLGELDGVVTLDKAVKTVAKRYGLSSSETAKLRNQALKLSRELLELGALGVNR